MYTLCFGMKMLVDDPQQRLLLEQLPLKNIIEHTLNSFSISCGIFLGKLNYFIHKLKEIIREIYSYHN